MGGFPETGRTTVTSTASVPPSAGTSAPGSAFGTLGRQGAEAWEYFTYYLNAKKDAAKLRLRQKMLKSAVFVVLGLAALAIIIQATGLVIAGIGEGFAVWFGTRWLGNLVGGLAVLALFSAAAGLVMYTSRRRSFAATRRKYEQRRQAQRVRFGHDITLDHHPRPD